MPLVREIFALFDADADGMMSKGQLRVYRTFYLTFVRLNGN